MTEPEGPAPTPQASQGPDKGYSQTADAPSQGQMKERILRKTIEIVEAIERPFSTEPKRYIKRGSHTVRERSLKYIAILKQKFDVSHEIPLEQAKRIFQDELDIWDRTSLKAYFGTQPDVSRRQIKRRAIYHNTGTVSPKTIELEQSIPKREGYLERLGLIKFEKRGKTWFVALVNNETIVSEICRSQTRVYERLEPEASKENFSLTPILQGKSLRNRFGGVSDRETEEVASGEAETEIERREQRDERECYRVREKSEVNESILEQPQASVKTWLTPTENATTEERDRKRLALLDRDYPAFLKKSAKNRENSP